MNQITCIKCMHSIHLQHICVNEAVFGRVIILTYIISDSMCNFVSCICKHVLTSCSSSCISKSMQLNFDTTQILFKWKLVNVNHLNLFGRQLSNFNAFLVNLLHSEILGETYVCQFIAFLLQIEPYLFEYRLWRIEWK